MWVFEEFENLGVTKDMCTDFALREGELSYDKYYEHFKAYVGKHKEFTATESSIPITIKRKAKSVLHKALRINDLDLYHGDALHLFEGLVTHLIEDTHHMIQGIISGPGETGSWLEQHKDEATRVAKTLLELEAKQDYQISKRSHGQWSLKKAHCSNWACSKTTKRGLS
jgi:hypothetical protein